MESLMEMRRNVRIFIYGFISIAAIRCYYVSLQFRFRTNVMQRTNAIHPL